MDLEWSLPGMQTPPFSSELVGTLKIQHNDRYEFRLRGVGFEASAG